MKRLSLIALVAAFVVSAFAFLASSAFAIPVFARKYNTQCNMCHTVPPRLNKFGVAFKENGFELPPGTVLPESEVYGNQVLSNEEPKAIVGAGFPFMIRSGLNTILSGTKTTAGVAANDRALSFFPGEFGLISGGSMETPFGGLGFWIDAPNAIIGAIDLDFNFNPMFKVSVGNDAPKVGYALGLTPNYIMGMSSPLALNTVVAGRNPAVITPTAGGTGFIFGDAGLPGIEVRGTTNPSTGLGINYAIGYRTGLAGPAAIAPAADPNTLYGHVSYFIDAINSNIGIGFSSENSGVANISAASQMLIDFAYGVGDNLIATVTYNTLTPGVATGLTANATHVAVAQIEYTVSPTITVGGRYAAYSGPGKDIAVGVNYKLLQNIFAWANYTSKDNGIAGAGAITSSAVTSGIDFIF